MSPRGLSSWGGHQYPPTSAGGFWELLDTGMPHSRFQGPGERRPQDAAPTTNSGSAASR
ncbi:similar to hypothetical protein MGC35169, isoform CRA_b [Rattus norvegicus]|uniref:Uncharacterized protein LOC498664 n=1 Tax=Rattus norvegicus TaxID=10116 RepID=A6IWN0_RAT|nr:similar to hypothetical protein MGC35169, isoform CRA_b [Rattus norvegicus]